MNVLNHLMLVFCLSLYLHSFAVADTAQPNVVVILTDDQGWGDLSLNGNQNLETPSIDSIASQGVQFDRFYVCPVCSPTRAEFLTGRYHARGGVYSTSAGGERLDLDEVTIAKTFQLAGYRTGAFGKWHNGMQYPYHPNGRGFDEFYGFCSGHWGDYFSPPLERNGQIVEGDGFCVDDFTNHALRFMEESVAEAKPFFAYLPYNTPHSPMQVPDEYWGEFESKKLKMRNRDPEKEQLDHTRCALAMCENIDWNVGRILKALDSWDIADNTIVVYFCDNGPNGFRWNGDMKGRKGSTDEGGVRSPCLLRWPSKIEGGRKIVPIAGAIDLLPTLADLCDVPLASKKPLDGKSLAPLLVKSEDVNWPDREIVSHWKGRVSVRNQQFRLDINKALFDINKDPGQRTNVAKQYPKVVEAMSRTAENFRAEIEGYDEDEREFLLGHQNYAYTQLPARDAIASGNIKRSNKFPNCSFFTNWTSESETIRFPVRVGWTGKYRVKLQYACQQASVGTKLELSFRYTDKSKAKSSLVFELTEAFDPPLRGGENDRVKRVESYVKDFATVDIGEIELREGDGELVLQPIKIEGDEVMDFRLLFFTKVE